MALIGVTSEQQPSPPTLPAESSFPVGNWGRSKAESLLPQGCSQGKDHEAFHHPPRPSWLLPVLQLRGFWCLLDMAGWGPEELRGPGASGTERDQPRLSPPEQQHCATSPGSPALHLVQRTRAGGRRGVRKEREGGEGRAGALADAHTHRAYRGLHRMALPDLLSLLPRAGCCPCGTGQHPLLTVGRGKGAGRRRGPHAPSERGRDCPGTGTPWSLFAGTWQGKSCTTGQ